MASTIRAISPYRLSFAGGFTDLSEYYERYGGAVIESAIGTYARASIEPRQDGRIIIKQARLGIEEEGSIGNLHGIRDFYRVIIEHFSPGSGFELSMDTDTEYGSGLGSSSASIVSIIGAFDGWLGTGMGKGEIAELAHKFERTKLGIHLGKQDPYATSFGGLNYIEFSGAGVEVKRIGLGKSRLEHLGSMLMLVNTATPRPVESPLKTLVKLIAASDVHALELMERMKGYAESIRDAIASNRFEQVGQLVYNEWLNKRALLDNISSKRIDALFKLSMENGATGGKLLGIGGGGHMLLVLDPDKRDRLVGVLSKEKLRMIEPVLVTNGLTVSAEVD